VKGLTHYLFFASLEFIMNKIDIYLIVIVERIDYRFETESQGAKLLCYPDLFIIPVSLNKSSSITAAG
jgi:hypothetical protein